jgi:hypothetical protein
VAATLRPFLIFDLNGADARALELAHGAENIDRPAIAGVGVGDHRNGHHIGDSTDMLDDLLERNDADVRGAENAHRYTRAGDIDGREPRCFDQPRGDAVEFADTRADLPELLTRVRPCILRIGMNARDRNPFELRQSRIQTPMR